MELVFICSEQTSSMQGVKIIFATLRHNEMTDDSRHGHIVSSFRLSSCAVSWKCLHVAGLPKTSRYTMKEVCQHVDLRRRHSFIARASNACL